MLAGYNDLASLYPDLAMEWSPRNKGLRPEDVTAGSHKKVWWKGVCGHEWQAVVKNRIQGAGCPYCSSNRLLPGFNDLASKRPELAEEWSDRNLPLKPSDVMEFTNRKAWWRCRTCGNEWDTLISIRSGGSQCPYCSGIRLLGGFNDLGTTHPEIAAEWSAKNGSLRPENVNELSRRNVWWRCKTCGHLLIDIQERIQGKGAGYERWAKVYNLKQISETFLFMREQHIESFEDLYAKSEAAVERFNGLNDQIKSAESRMAANLALQKHIQNYARTKDVYAAYRKSGYSRKFFEEHRAELTLHKAAKDAFNALGSEKIPSIRRLRQEYADLISQKKAAYRDYREAKKQMQEFLKARQNVEMFYGEEMKEEREAAKNRQEEIHKH